MISTVTQGAFYRVHSVLSQICVGIAPLYTLYVTGAQRCCLLRKSLLRHEVQLHFTYLLL